MGWRRNGLNNTHTCCRLILEASRRPPQMRPNTSPCRLPAGNPRTAKRKLKRPRSRKARCLTRLLSNHRTRVEIFERRGRNSGLGLDSASAHSIYTRGQGPSTLKIQSKTRGTRHSRHLFRTERSSVSRVHLQECSFSNPLVLPVFNEKKFAVMNVANLLEPHGSCQF